MTPAQQQYEADRARRWEEGKAALSGLGGRIASAGGAVINAFSPGQMAQAGEPGPTGGAPSGPPLAGAAPAHRGPPLANAPEDPGAAGGITPPGNIQQRMDQATTPQKPSLDTTDPHVARKTAEQSAEAARNTSPEDKAKVNGQLEDTFGPGAIEKTYNEILARIKGDRSKADAERDDGHFSFHKLSKEDRGMFVMDFGMRLMAASGRWNAQLGGAIGEAGVGAMAGAEDRYQKNYALGEEQRRYNDTADREDAKTALDLAELETAPASPDHSSYDTGLGPDGKLYHVNLSAGDFVRDQNGDPIPADPNNGRGALGGSGMGGARQQMYGLMTSNGYNEREAMAVANGASTPERVYQIGADIFDKMVSEGKMHINGKRGSIASDAEKAKARDDFARQRMEQYRAVLRGQGAAGGPALSTDVEGGPGGGPAIGGSPYDHGVVGDGWDVSGDDQ